MMFKVVVQSIQYAVYNIQTDSLKQAVFLVDGLDPTSANLPIGVTVDVPLMQSAFQNICIQDANGNPIVLELSGFNTGSTG